MIYVTSEIQIDHQEFFVVFMVSGVIMCIMSYFTSQGLSLYA